MFLKFDDSEEYTDNQFGSMIESMLNSNYDFCAIVFNDSAFIINKDPSPSAYRAIAAKKIILNNENFYECHDIIEDIVIDCYKNIGYIFMTIMRKIHPQYKNLDFPMNEIKFQFYKDGFLNFYDANS
jgi:hypothetical protein